MKTNGLLLLHKSENITSNKIIQLIKNKFKIQKIGHCGTLDPAASGLLIICINGATKNSTRIINYKKKYIAIAIIGIKSITDDLDGKITFYEKQNKKIKSRNIKEELKNIERTNYHFPHLFSSIKHNGISMYKFSRLDIKMRINEKENTIENIKIIKNNKNILIIKITCKHGIYIRSIINNLSKKIKKPICTFKIIRTHIKNYNILNSYNYKDLIRYTKIENFMIK